MKWNASYSYRNPVATEFVDGGSCYIEQVESKQLRETEYGNELVLDYKMYVKNASRFEVERGSVVDVLMQDGQQFFCTVVGVDFTVHKVYTVRIAHSTPFVVANGSVSFKYKTGGGFEAITGYPVVAKSYWGEPVECHWATVSMDLLAIGHNEHFTNAKFVVYILGNTLPTEQMKLSDNNGDVLGEYSVISYEYLQVKGVTKIIV